jgi:hypothetical protein
VDAGDEADSDEAAARVVLDPGRRELRLEAAANSFRLGFQERLGL